MARITDFEPLLPAEETLLEGLSSGEVVDIGDGELPADRVDRAREIRGAFLREVILDSFEDLGEHRDLRARVHEKGVQLAGARITGPLDLEGGSAPRDVVLFSCRFEAAPVLRSACLGNLFLNGSVIPGLSADRLDVKGGVFLRGVTATGEVRLAGAKLGGDLSCTGATFQGVDGGDGLSADGLDAKGSVILRGVTATSVVRLAGATLGGDLSCVEATFHGTDGGHALMADRVQATGSGFLRGVTAEGEVRLGGARLGGGLDCDDATFRGTAGGDAFMADGLDAKGGVSLRGVTAEGMVRLLGAKLEGDLSCNEAIFRGTDGDFSLAADRLEATGSVFLTGLTATGMVRLAGARIGGDLSCDGARFTCGSSDRALALGGVRVDGAIILRGARRIDGVLDLSGAALANLVDAEDGWPTKGNLILNRCTYGAFLGGPVDAYTRIDWLDLQDPTQWGDDFWPQPWEQCAKVLREMGHREDARRVLIAKEKRQRAAVRARAWASRGLGPVLWGAGIGAGAGLAAGIAFGVWTGGLAFIALALFIGLGWWRWGKDLILNVTVRYGHVPLLAFAWLGGFLALGTLVFGLAAANDAIKPNSSRMFRAAEWANCRPPDAQDTPAYREAYLGKADETQLACFLRQPEARAFPGFSPLIYSADTLLPIVDLEMQGYWIPDDKVAGWGVWVRRFLWVQIFAGWALSLLAVAGFSGLIRTDSK